MPIDMKVEPGTASLTIGNDYASGNSISFTVTLTGEGRIYLTMELPLGPGGVLRNVEDSNRITFDPPRTVKPIQGALPRTKKWSLGDYNNGIAVNGTVTMSITIANIPCTVSEGKRALTITAEAPQERPVNRKLEITIAKPATSPQNPILYFIAEPTNLIGSGTVTLAWDVIGDQEPVLIPPSGAVLKAEPAANQRIYSLSSSGTFSLKAPGKSQQLQQVTVSVLASNKWQPLKPLGDKAFPSVIFDSCGLSEDDLYAIFLRGNDREAVLCKSKDGITGWEVINSDVPAGMETSPGVLLKRKLWLVGGSTVDFGLVSGRIFYYDLDASSKGWQEASIPGFADKARMGHACTVDSDHIWVLGGLDRYGTLLSDVLRLDVDANKDISRVLSSDNPEGWNKTRFSSRCMFSAVRFNDRIWVCGGVTSPNGNPLGDIFTSPSLPFEPSHADWKPYSGSKELKNAIGAGAATSAGRLFTLMTTRELQGNAWEGGPKMRPLDLDAETPRWGDDGISPILNNPVRQWTAEPHSISMVGFQKRLYLRYLHKDALYGKQDGAPLFVLPLE